MGPIITAQDDLLFKPPRKRSRRTSIPKISLQSKNNFKSVISSSMLILFILISLLKSSLTITYADQNLCQPTNSWFCNNDNYYTWLAFNNSLGHTDLESARSDLHRYTYLIEMPQCKERVSLFLCSLYFPVCINESDMPPRMLLPCRETCLEARLCESEVKNYSKRWPEEWDCDRFEYYNKSLLCVMDTQSKIDNDRPSSIETTPPLRTMESKQEHDLSKQSSESPDVQTARQSDVRQASENPVNLSICEPGLFDCKLSDPKRPLCIDMKYVCDGKRDCYRNDSLDDPNEGLDELKCLERCFDEGQLQCDDRCISRQDICNGRVDCSSGIDEQDCYDNIAGLIQSVLCIFVMSSAIFILVKFLRVEREKVDNRDCETSCEEGNISDLRQRESPPMLIEQEQYKQPQPISNKITSPLMQLVRDPTPQPMIISQNSLPISLPPEPMYQEVSTRGESVYNYERILTGGYSGASSIYASEYTQSWYGELRPYPDQSNPDKIRNPPPTPPPPTRSGTPIYQSSASMKNWSCNDLTLD